MHTQQAEADGATPPAWQPRPATNILKLDPDPRHSRAPIHGSRNRFTGTPSQPMAQRFQATDPEPASQASYAAWEADHRIQEFRIRDPNPEPRTI